MIDFFHDYLDMWSYFLLLFNYGIFIKCPSTRLQMTNELIPLPMTVRDFDSPQTII